MNRTSQQVEPRVGKSVVVRASHVRRVKIDGELKKLDRDVERINKLLAKYAKLNKK